MEVVCGTSSASVTGVDNLVYNSTSTNLSCTGEPVTSCNDDQAADTNVITNACALFDFVVYTVVMGSLASLGVIGNVISFVVLLRDRGRSATAFLLQALAVADTMVLLAAVPLYVMPPIYPYTRHLAAFYSAYLSLLPILWPIYFIPYTFTVLVTVLVSMHRYCAVCKPTVSRCAPIGASSLGACGGRGSSSIRFSPSTARQARYRVAALAAFSVIYNIPRFFEYESVPACGDGNKGSFKISSFGDNLVYRILYANLLYFVVIHGGPFLLIGFFNVKLILALKRRQRRWAEMGKGWYQQDVSLVLVVVMCVFIVCQSPTFIDQILWTFVDKSERTCGRWHYYYTAIGDVFVIFNSSINFVIYIVTSRNFRHGLIIQTLSTWINGVGTGGRTSATTAVSVHATTVTPRELLVNERGVGAAVTPSSGAAIGRALVASSPRRHASVSLEMVHMVHAPPAKTGIAKSGSSAAGINRLNDELPQTIEVKTVRYFEPRVLFR